MANRSKAQAVRAPEVNLVHLTGADGAALSADPDHDGQEFVGLDLDHFDAGNTRFVECRVAGCRFTALTLRRSRFIGCSLEELDATTVDISDSEWTDVVVQGGRLGALLAPGAQLVRVALRQVRSNYLNLRGSKIVDLSLTGCRIGELDLGTADVLRADFRDCEIERLVLTGASWRSVDLRHAEIGEIEGIAELRGATINPVQLTRLGPAFAQQLGVRVDD